MKHEKTHWQKSLPDSPGFWIQYFHREKMRIVEIVTPPYLVELCFYDPKSTRVFRPVTDLDLGHCLWTKVREPTDDEIFGRVCTPSCDPSPPTCDLPAKWRQMAREADDLAKTQTGAARTMLLAEARIYRKAANELEAELHPESDEIEP